MFSFRFPRAQCPARRPAPRRRGLRPRLEALEDRCVPSTLKVTNASDNVNQAGSLRYELAHAKSGDTIQIQTSKLPQGQIVLTNGELDLTKNVTIQAVGKPATISGDALSRVFEVAGGAKVTLSNLTLTDGAGVAGAGGPADLDGFGGAVAVDFGGTLKVNQCTVSSSNADGGGGGIWDGGTLTLSKSTVVGNTGFYGGGIMAVGAATVSQSTVTGNIGVAGGGIDVTGTLTLTNSTLSYNQANAGGAIDNQSGYSAPNPAAVSVSGSKFVGNTPDNIAPAAAYTDGGGNKGLP
jgi:hypothetical protein